MNLETQRIFLVGPGGVGKSTVGEILANKLGYRFVDVDKEFNLRIKPIPQYVQEYSYRGYCEANSELFQQLLIENPSQTVFPLPAGFLVHEGSEDIARKHRRLLIKHGVSILILPAPTLKGSIEIVVARQLSKGFTDTNEQNERESFKRRYRKYRPMGDLKIFSQASPEEIAELITEQLATLS